MRPREDRRGHLITEPLSLPFFLLFLITLPYHPLSSSLLRQVAAGITVLSLPTSLGDSFARPEVCDPEGMVSSSPNFLLYLFSFHLSFSSFLPLMSNPTPHFSFILLSSLT